MWVIRGRTHELSINCSSSCLQLICTGKDSTWLCSSRTSGILDRLEEINATFGKPTLLDVIAELEAQSASAGPDSWAR